MATLDRKCINIKSFAETSELFQMDCRRLKVSTALYVYEGQGGFILFHRLFCRGGMYTFYSSNILYIMFILCDEYARRYTTHWAESEPVNVECGRCLAAVVSCKTQVRERTDAHHITVRS